MLLKTIKTRRDPEGNHVFKNNSGAPYSMIFATFEGDNIERSIYIALDKPWGKKNLEVIKTWKVGDDVPVILEDSADGKWKNFKIAGKTDLLEQKVNSLEKRLCDIEAKLGKTAKPTTPAPNTPQNQPQRQSEAIPPYQPPKQQELNLPF